MQTSHTITKPSFMAWATAIVCALLFAALLNDLRSSTSETQGGPGYGMLILLGAATAGSVWRIVRDMRHSAMTVDADRVPVGVPIRPSRARPLLVAAVLVAIGIGALLDTHEPTRLMRGGAWVCMGVGAALAAAVAAGWLPRGHLTFRDDALLIGMPTYTVAIPWERIRGLEGSEYAGNPAIYFWFDTPDTFVVTRPARQEAFLRQVAYCRKLLSIQADFYYMTMSLPVAMPDLVAAMVRRCGPLAAPGEPGA